MQTYTLKLDTTETDTGDQLSALAVALGLPTYSENDEMDYEYKNETMQSAFDKINHEKILIELFNEYGEDTGWLKDSERLGGGWCFTEETAIDHEPCFRPQEVYLHSETNLLFGAWLALNHEDAFNIFLKAFTDYMKELSEKCLGDYSGMPKDYQDQLNEDYKWHKEYCFDLYLKGDQSGGGLLREAIDFLFSRYTRDARARYDIATDTITIEAEDRVITDYLIEKQGEDEMQACTLPAQDVIEKLLSDDLNSSKVAELAKRKQKREERIKEWETKKILNEEREAKKREERRARLEAMTK